MRRISGAASLAVLALVVVGLPGASQAAPAQQRQAERSPVAPEPSGRRAGQRRHRLPRHRHDHGRERRHPRAHGAQLPGPAGPRWRPGRPPDAPPAPSRASARPSTPRCRSPRRPAVSQVRRAPSRSSATRKSSRLVVDATSGTGRARVGGPHRRQAARRHAEPARDVRRRRAPARSSAASSRSRPSTAPASRSTPAPSRSSSTQSGSAYQLKDPTRGNTYTTDLNNAEDSIFCQLFGSGCKTGTHVHQPGHVLRQRHAPAAGSRRAWTRSTART